MPPVTKAGGEQFRKDVAFAATEKDEDGEYELRATGIVMVPDKVDLQADFAREETIRGFADQFATFYEAGQAGGGVMHAVFPDGWMDLERNEVLDEAEEIGDETADAGAWVQEWGIADPELAGLIEDGILEGYSIGAIQVDWAGPYEVDDVDDVEVPNELGEDPLIWELTDGIIREVSAVDIPAVPDAQILEAKALEKRLSDHLGNRDAFIAEALERGHSEADAERLWDVLNAAVETEGSDEPGKQSLFAKAGKAFLNALTGTDDDDTAKTSEDPGHGRDRDHGAAKEGRTLSTANQNDLKASIDAAVSILNDAGVDHGITRFTDREDDPFDLSEHTAREFADPDDEEGDEEQVSPMNDAPGGDTPDADTTDMSNDTDDPMADAPEWAKALNDRIDDLESEGEKDADADSDDPLADAPEWAKDLAERVDEIEEKALDDAGAEAEEDKPEWAKDLEARIDRISQQSGVSTQLEAGRDTEESDESGLEGLGKALS
ncbi:XkdF-like putative serine protease domain-containing protein [Salinilacihabitans rarus]|uniref:XkdF-like putative serine protease domain-containing protein n=1 Tax=Salinilacihabitans rarus TaxID=2961596 RepID=UPI0020C8CC21|nr:XkdF-like putative serine protease domain-containing protein [Salinilacihabitans rarus]